jgi:hypothetical protein
LYCFVFVAVSFLDWFLFTSFNSTSSVERSQSKPPEQWVKKMTNIRKFEVVVKLTPHVRLVSLKICT